MDIARDASRTRGVVTERQPLLPSPPSENDGSNPSNSVDMYNSVTDDSNLHVSSRMGTKLGASALNFFLSGIAMAAVGVFHQ